jgi:hypothetical protein
MFSAESSDQKTAVAVAEAILTPIYGQAQIASERPFTANLDDNGVWTVKGYLPKAYFGGTAEIKLSRDDRRVLFLTHYK